MSNETQPQIITPAQFEAQLTNSAIASSNQDQEPADELADTSTADAEKEKNLAVAEKDALGVEKPSDDKHDKPSVDESDQEKKETVEEELYEVKIDGEKQRVTAEELKKSYERYKASTQRFQEASEIKKEAETAKARAEQTEQKAKAAFNQLLTNPDAILDIIGTHAPETLHRAFEKYAQRHVADQELREKDPGLYDATLEQRRQQAEIKRQQQDLEKQRRWVEEEKNRSKQDAERSIIQKTIETYNGAVPGALKSAGVPAEMIDSMLIKNTLRELVNSSWPNDLLLKDLPNLVGECAKELVKDPAIIAMIGKPKEEPKVEPKEKKVTVTQPTDHSGNPKFIRPNDFFKEITKNLTPRW